VQNVGFIFFQDCGSVSGFYWRQFMTDTGAEPEAWNYLAVVVPIVVFFGPFGSFVSSHFHRQVLAMFIYVLDTLALVRRDFQFCIFTAAKNTKSKIQNPI
jgi:hypothetical protein